MSKKTYKGGTRKKGHLPKRIGGLTIPKELRKTGDALIEKANSPEGRQAIASGLAMIGGLVAANAARKHADKAEPARDAAEPAGAKPAAKPGTPGTNAQQMADQIGAAADMLIGRIFAKR